MEMRPVLIIICLGLLAAVATLLGLLGQSDSRAAGEAPVTAVEQSIDRSYNGAILRFELNRPAKTTLYLNNVLASRRGMTQVPRFDPGCLSPNHSYAYKLTTKIGKREKVLDSGNFSTLPVPDKPVDARAVRDYATIGGRACFLTIGSPYGGGGVFCPRFISVDDQLALGVNVLAEESPFCSANTEENNRLMHEAFFQKAWFLLLSVPDQRYPVSFPELLNFFPAGEKGRLLWSLESSTWRFGICGASAASLYSEVAKMVKPHRPSMLEVNLGSRGRCLTPAKLGVLVWLPVLAGTKGVIFAQTVDRQNRFDVEPAIAAQTKRLTVQAGNFGPVVFGQRLFVGQVKGSIKVGAWRYQGSTYVLAINTSQRASLGRFTLPAARALRATVLWESRSVKLKKSVLSDRFKGWGIHFYRLP
jgi:hypothetical protein